MHTPRLWFLVAAPALGSCHPRDPRPISIAQPAAQVACSPLCRGRFPPAPFHCARCPSPSEPGQTSSGSESSIDPRLSKHRTPCSCRHVVADVICSRSSRMSRSMTRLSTPVAGYLLNGGARAIFEEIHDHLGLTLLFPGTIGADRPRQPVEQLSAPYAVIQRHSSSPVSPFS